MALPAPASARQDAHAPITVAAGEIKIHGHWVIDVRNPDGTLAERREFDNALLPSGAAHLAALLARQITPGTWFVSLGSTTPSGPCTGMVFGGVGSNACWLVSTQIAGSPFLGPAAFTTLTQTLGGPNSSQVILAGNLTVKTAGQIDRVQTHQPRCANAVVACNVIIAGDTFTSHDLRDASGNAAPLPVTPGQIVQVTVTFNFCSSQGCPS